MDLFILKTDVEKFTSTNKKTLHLIFKFVCEFGPWFNILLCRDGITHLLAAMILNTE